MRITSEGVTVPPDVAVDEAAKAVIAALDDHIKHIVSKRDAINSALARRYPASAPPQTGIGGVNQALSANALVMVNGVPTLTAK